MFLATRAFLIMAFVSLAGGHWAILHALAWGQMIHESATHLPFAQAVAKTFKSDDACHVCEMALEEHKKEDSPSTGSRPEKTELLSLVAHNLLDSPNIGIHSYAQDTELIFVTRAEAPPRPVPRTV